MAAIHVIELRGDSRQRGEQHGNLLRGPIERAVEFYFPFFARHLGIDRKEVRRRAATFIEPTSRLSAALMAEYEGIAAGSGQHLEDIFALSARYEITFEEFSLGECSNVYVGPGSSATGHTLLGQNWDWRPEVMDFRAVFVARSDDGPDHVMITECGQPGKYGLNQFGLGVVAAGLNCTEKASLGEQLFVALGRAALEHEKLAGARDTLARFATRSTVNVLVGAAGGAGVDFEYTPRSVGRRDLAADEVYWHTNHCREVDEPCTFENSRLRGQRWDVLSRAPRPIDRAAVQAWLADRRSGDNSICQLCDPQQADTPTRVQTLSSVVLDLGARTMWASDGPSCASSYQPFALA